MSHPDQTANAASFDSAHDDVFGRIASRYDVLCDLFSLFIHRSWKRRVAHHIASRPWNLMLDAAAGTGDIALRVMGRVSDPERRRCIVSDISPAMLAVAERRAGSRTTGLDFRTLDAHHMPQIASDSIDLYAMSLGMKICDRHLALEEAWRVLRPGGTFVCLEASDIPVAPLQRAYLAYMRVCMPLVGWIATGGDSSAYAYLLRGIESFPGAEAFAEDIKAKGFLDVRHERLSLGIVAIHTARKPFSS